MPHYVLNRNYTHRSIHGHSVGFEKGVPVWVPPGPIEREVTAIGAEIVDGEKIDLVPADQKPKEQLTAEEIELLMREAFVQLSTKNDAADFTGAGIPTVKAMEKIVGENLTAKMIADLWQKVREEAAQ